MTGDVDIGYCLRLPEKDTEECTNGRAKIPLVGTRAGSSFKREEYIP